MGRFWPLTLMTPLRELLAKDGWDAVLYRLRDPLLDVVDAFVELQDIHYDHGQGSADPDSEEIERADEAAWGTLAALRSALEKEGLA